jgi:hypothetical protein
VTELLMRIARYWLPPAVVVAAVLATAVISVTGLRPITEQSAASVTTISQGTTGHQGSTGPTGSTRGGASTAATATAKFPGWRVVATFGPAHGVPVTGSVTAASATVAWSVWTGHGYSAVARWTGKAWVRVPLPAKLAPYAHAAVAFGGDSGSDFWLFSAYRTTQALRWTGKSWRLQPIPSWVMPKPSSGASAVVFSVDNVWVFNHGAGAFGAHYNGRAWMKVKLPDTPVAVTGLTPGDIYVLGKNSVLRWTGSTWRTIGGMPPVSIPVGGTFTADAFTASAPADAWLAASAYDKAGNLLGRFLFHWNGKSWATAARPADIIGALAPDGAGGLWASGLHTGNPGGFWYLYHLTGGRWAQLNPPVPVFNHEQQYLTWIPGTRSLWGVATGFTATSTFDTVLLKYGP